MDLKDLLAEDRVIIGLNAKNKSQALRVIAEKTAIAMDLDRDLLLDGLLQREALGSTGVGGGVAVPHARISGEDKVRGMFLRFDTPVDFDAIDDAKVDLFFVLIASPESGAEHLRALAQVSRSLRHANMREKLRLAPDADACRIILSSEGATNQKLKTTI